MIIEGRCYTAVSPSNQIVFSTLTVRGLSRTVNTLLW